MFSISRPLPLFPSIPALVGIAIAVGTLSTTSIVTPARAADCNVLLDDFNRAVDAGDEAKAQGFVDRIATDADCGRFQVPAQRRLAALRLTAAQLLMARGRPVNDFDRLLKSAESPEVLWQASATIGEVRFGERRFSDAAQAYDRAIEIIKNETLTPIATLEIRNRRAGREIGAVAAPGGQWRLSRRRSLRADRQGLRATAHWVASIRARCAASSRGPCRSRSRSSIAKPTFTGVGEQAAQELVTALKEQRPSRITWLAIPTCAAPQNST